MASGRNLGSCDGQGPRPEQGRKESSAGPGLSLTRAFSAFTTVQVRHRSLQWHPGPGEEIVWPQYMRLHGRAHPRRGGRCRSRGGLPHQSQTTLRQIQCPIHSRWGTTYIRNKYVRILYSFCNSRLRPIKNCCLVQGLCIFLSKENRVFSDLNALATLPASQGRGHLPA